ncbi:MAG: Dabb family protein [Bacteroidales bacterium]
MIKHIVMIKLKKFDSEEEKQSVADNLRGKLEHLVDTIADLHSMEVGMNIVNRPSAYDLVLTAKFDDLKGLDRYRQHMDHIEVLNYLFENTDKTAVVDYEV